MSKRVRATERGYFGGEIREAGDTFAIPLKLWEGKKTRPSWVEAVKASKVAEPASAEAAVGALASMTVPELREMAEAGGIDLNGVTVKADIIKAIEDAKSAPVVAEAEAFADAPPPEHIKAENSVTKELGGAADWIAPGTEI